MAEATDLENLRGILLGLGLNALPSVLMNLQKARNAGRNLGEGRSHKDDGPPSVEKAQDGAAGAYDLQSVLAPLLQQMGGAGGQGGQASMPVNTPGMRPGLPPAPLPRMPGLPRTMAAGASPAGF